jgi:flagellar motor switch protein FliM
MSADKPQKSEADVLSDWESMLQEPASTPDAKAAPTQSQLKALNQSEIDSLLGVSTSKDSKDHNKGVKAVLEKALQTYDKLPMLEIVFDRLVRLLTTALRNLTTETVDVDIANYSSLRFGNYIKTIPLPTLITVFKAVEWENLGLLIIDSSLIFSFVDTLFGGKKSNMPLKVEGRAYTDIEQAMIKQVSEIMLNELGSAFDPLSPVTFAFDRTETNPNFATICRPGDAAILLQLRVDMESRGGKIDILLPYVTIEPIKPLLTQVFMGERFGSDIEWEENLLTSIYDVEVELEAVIVNKPLRFVEVASMQIGQTIVLEQFIDQDIIIRSKDVKVFSAKLGKVDNNVAFHITKVYDNDDEEK